MRRWIFWKELQDIWWKERFNLGTVWKQRLIRMGEWKYLDIGEKHQQIFVLREL